MIASNQINVLKEFCALMLCGHQENAFQHCKTCMESAADEYGGIPDVLYVLSGHAVDSEDPFGNVADLEKQPVKPQYYMVSSDAGAQALEDFFCFIENKKAARGLTFSIHEEKFSDDDCIIEWLAELAGQLEGQYNIVNFDGASEDYHFTIMNKEDCEKAMNLFEQLTADIDGYSYKAFFITDDFEG